MKKKEDGKNLNTLILCQKINDMHKLQTDYSLLASDLFILIFNKGGVCFLFKF